MDDLSVWMGQHRAITLALLGALLLIVGAFSRRWLNQALRDEVVWTGGRILLEVRRDDMPTLYWMTIFGQRVMTAFLLLAGLGLLSWSLIELLTMVTAH